MDKGSQNGYIGLCNIADLVIYNGKGMFVATCLGFYSFVFVFPHQGLKQKGCYNKCGQD